MSSPPVELKLRVAVIPISGIDEARKQLNSRGAYQAAKNGAVHMEGVLR